MRAGWRWGGGSSGHRTVQWLRVWNQPRDGLKRLAGLELRVQDGEAWFIKRGLAASTETCSLQEVQRRVLSSTWATVWCLGEAHPPPRATPVCSSWLPAPEEQALGTITCFTFIVSEPHKPMRQVLFSLTLQVEEQDPERLSYLPKFTGLQAAELRLEARSVGPRGQALICATWLPPRLDLAPFPRWFCLPGLDPQRIQVGLSNLEFSRISSLLQPVGILRTWLASVGPCFPCLFWLPGQAGESWLLRGI